MKRVLLLAVVLLGVRATTASAGVYGGLAIGTNGFSEDQKLFSDDGRAGRLFGGYRFPSFAFGAISLEGGVEGYSLYNPHSTNTDYTGSSWFAAGKFSLPLGSGLEAFGRLGIQKTSVSGDVDLSANASYLIGVGAEFRFALGPTATGSVFVELNRNAATLTGLNRPDDYSVNRTVLGFSVGM
jgi:hypothetical protein